MLVELKQACQSNRVLTFEEGLRLPKCLPKATEAYERNTQKLKKEVWGVDKV